MDESPSYEELEQRVRELRMVEFERTRSEVAHRESEEKWRNILVKIPMIGLTLDPRETIVFANEYFLELTGWTEAEVLGQNWFDLFIPPEIREEVRGMFITAMRSKDAHGYSSYENEILTKTGERLNVAWSNVITRASDGGVLDVTCMGVDLTERKRAEEERKANVRFLEILDRVNCAIQQSDSVEQMLDDVIQITLSIFECDRAWLLFPCDPEAPSFRVFVEATRPEYPGAQELNLTVPMSPPMQGDMIDALFADGPVTFGAGNDKPISTDSHKCYTVQSQMFMSIHPKEGSAWLFGVHQCSNSRVWTVEERRVFDEIGHRLTEGLSSLLYLRELRVSERNLRSIFDVAQNVAFIKTDLNGKAAKIIEFSPGAENIFGYKREEVIGRPVAMLHLEADVERFPETIEANINKSEGFSGESMLVRKSGEIFPALFTTYPVLDEDGKVESTVGVSIDISELRQAEEALRESEEKFRSLLSSFSGASYRSKCDKAWTIIYLSEGIEGLCGYPPSDFVNNSVRTFESIIHRDDTALTEKEVMDCVHAGVPWDIEYRIVHKDGSVRWVLETGRGIKDDGGIVQYLDGFVHDISDRKRAEEEREKLESQLVQSQKMESIGRLAGGVAHDFNNMLSVILGYTELIFNDLPQVSPLRAELEEIRKAAERSANLTRQLLAFARKQAVVPQTLELNETVSSMLKMLGRLIGEDIELHWEPGEDLEFIRIDPGQVDQLLANVVVNARHAIGNNVGKVVIRTSNASFDEAYCASHAEFSVGNYVMLSVADDGGGMDAETVENIFEPFYTTKDVSEGTGLGLSTVYGIVKQNNGFVNVDSELGTGTTFRFYLPVYEDASASQGDAGSNIIPATGGRECILLVEDEPAVGDLTRKILERIGYAVLLVASPYEAIRTFEENSERIDLLITDVIMPGMNGGDLVARLLEQFPSLTYLYMSGYTSNIIAQQGVVAEGVNFIQKPFSVIDLSVKVRELLDKV